MKRIAILPLDGYPTGQALLEAMDKTLAINGLSDLVAYIKLNDGLHNEDIGGPAIVAEIKKRLFMKELPINIFCDFKIFDVSATVENVLKKYLKTPPGILTICSSCSVEGIIKLRELLPNTKLAMISVPTDVSKDECITRFGMTPSEKIYNDFVGIRKIYQQDVRSQNNPEPFDLVVCSKNELSFLDSEIPSHYGFVVPGVRDEWMKKKDEHQKRTTGIKELLLLARTRMVYAVMGAQLTKGNPEMGITPEESCRLTIEQIETADL